MRLEDEEPEEPEDMSLAFVIGVGSYSIHTDGKKNARYKKMDQIGFIRQKKNVSKVSSKNPAPRKRPTPKGDLKNATNRAVKPKKKVTRNAKA